MTENQLLTCQNFIQVFLSKVNPNDQLPVKISSSNICKIEIIGSILDWIIQYLNQWSCPKFFVTPFAKVILDEIRSELNKEDFPYYNRDINAYQALPLMQYVISKVQTICKDYDDIEKLKSIPLSNYNLSISVFATKNKRRHMEDRHIIVDNLPMLFNRENCEPISYYAIFDGHNGAGAATYTATHLHQFLAESQYFPMFPEQALTDAFKNTDKNFLEKLDTQLTRSGSTAVVALIYHETRMLYVAWAGDSEAMLSSKGRIQRLVYPHKAERKDEIKRIENVGGCVIYWQGVYRVNGQLAISRAIGDAEHKAYVISVPDIVSLQLEGEEDFLILGCDGLWDCMKPDEAARFVYEYVSTTPDKYELTSQLLSDYAKSRGSSDNITSIVVFLTDPRDIKRYDIDMETATAESFTTNQNGSTNYRPINNFDHVDEDDDDFGPETNVDNIDDVMSQSIQTKKSFLDSDTIKTSFNPLQSDVIQHEIDGDSKKGSKEDVNSGVCDNGDAVVSDESDDDLEWNYRKGDDSSKLNSSFTRPEQPEKIENSDDLSAEMDYTLNPDAVEFVPVSPKHNRDSSLSPEVCMYPLKNQTEKLMKEEFIASSPMKGQEKNMDDVVVPPLDVFQKEIKKRPSSIMPRFDDDDAPVDNHGMNNGDALLERSFENAANDNTYASTRAVFGDDSTYATNLEEVNKHLSEKEEYDEVEDEKATSVDKEHHFGAHNGIENVSTTNDANPFPDNSSENGAFESEDYPSIVEKKKPIEAEETNDALLSSSNITYGRDSGKYEVEKEVPPFGELLESHAANGNTTDFQCFTGDSTNEVIQKMTNFDYGTALEKSSFLGDDSTAFGANAALSPTQELFNGDKTGTNPFAVDNAHRDEKENAEEKEVDDSGDKDGWTGNVEFAQSGNSYEGFDPFGVNDQVDFKVKDNDPFQTSVYEDDVPTAPQLSDFEKTNDLIEPQFKAESFGDFTAKPETAHVVESSNDVLANKDISAQILDLDEFELHKAGSEELEVDNHESKSGTPGTEEKVTSEDKETPYIHDCTRLNDKPDSVHEAVSHKHFDDLLPDYEKSTTMESDKLESELRESHNKGVEFDLGFSDNFASCDRFKAAPIVENGGDGFQSMMCNLVSKPGEETKTESEKETVIDNGAEAEPATEYNFTTGASDIISVPEVSSNVENELINEATADEKTDIVINGLSTPPPSAVSQNQPENAVSIAEAVDKIANSQEAEHDDSVSATTAAVAAIGVATAVAAGLAVTTQDKKEVPASKKSVIKKPEEKAKAPAKPATTKGPAPSASKARTSTASSTLKSTTVQAKKPIGATTAAKTTPNKSTLASRPSTAKSTTPTARSSLTATKSSPLTAAPRTTTSASKPLTKPASSPLKSRPATASSLTSPRTTTAASRTSTLANGDVSASRVSSTLARKPSSTGAKKSLSSPTSAAPAKPAVSLATRTSLAPKPKSSITADKPKPTTTTLASKRPISASAKVPNKDSKDIANKRLSTTKPATAKLNSTTSSKTESKVNSGLKSTTLKTSSATAIKRPASQSNANQSETKTLNGNA